MNIEELRPKNYVPITVSGKASKKIREQNHSPVFIKTVEMDFLGWISKDLPASQEEELRQILYPGELLKKVHIKGSLLYIWCFFYERSHFLAFPCQIFFLRLRNIHVVLRSAQQSAPRGRSASISIIGLFLRPTLH